MAQSKATKKFERSKLKDTLKQRKEGAKIKQRHAVAAKKKARRAEDTAPAKDVETPTATSRQSKDSAATQTFEDMNVDDFFNQEIEVPLQSPKRKREQANGAAKKQKRSADADVHSDESDDAEEPESDPVDQANSDSDDDFESHQQQLEALAEKDPEFHKYLQDNDPELLELQDTNLDEFEDPSEDEADSAKGKRGKKAAKNEVTSALVTKWQTSMKKQHSLRATREVVLAFRAAVHVSAEEDKNFKYTISNPEVYHELLLTALNDVTDVLQHHLPIKEGSHGKIRVPTESKKFSSLSPLLKSHLMSIIYLLGHLSDPTTVQLTLASVMRCLPYILSYKRLIRELSRNAVNVWSEASYNESCRIAAFLVLRRLITIGDPGIREGVLRATYQGLVKGSRNTTIHTMPGINLMKNSAAELWGIDSSVGYTTGFTFIRQLAIHLRNSITHNANDSFRTVYNWQYVHSLDFWSRVLSAHCDKLTEAQKGQESPLRPLVYPLVQVTLGAMRLIPSSTYFPLRFHLIRALLRISSATGTYIPVAAALYEVLNSAEMRKPPKGSTLKPLDFAVAFRAPKSYLKTRVYQDGVGEQVQELLGEFLYLWTKSIAFPELALPIVVMLKRWLKEVGPHSKAPNQNAKISGVISLLVQKVDANCKWIEQRRAKVDFAPNNRVGVDGFLKDVESAKTPLGAFVAGQRKSREEKQKMLEESRRDDETRKAQDKKKQDEERQADPVQESDDEEEMDLGLGEVDDDSE